MIIGLSGYARSGKDTVAGMLIGLHQYQRVAFADKIKTFLYEIDPLIMVNGVDVSLQNIIDSKDWETAKAEFPEIRGLLQRLGVSARSIFGYDFWIDQALRDYNVTEKIVITDVRFKNEAAAIKRHKNGQVWRINRIGVGPANDHVSETDLDDWEFDAVIKNNSDMPNLINQIKHLLG